jgi:hypothetical protein
VDGLPDVSVGGAAWVNLCDNGSAAPKLSCGKEEFGGENVWRGTRVAPCRERMRGASGIHAAHANGAPRRLRIAGAAAASMAVAA